MANATPASSSSDVHAWLAELSLERYAAAIKEYGYDTMLILADASEEDIIEMTEDPDVAMKKPHRKTIVNAVRAYLRARMRARTHACVGMQWKRLGKDEPKAEPEQVI